MSEYYPRNPIDEERRRLILERLEKERELRRQHVRDGTIDQFQLEDITDSNNYSNAYNSNAYYPDESQMSDMKDPSQILLLDPEEEEAQDYYLPNPETQYQVVYQQPYEVPQMHPQPEQMHQMPYSEFGFNPENLYDPNTMQSFVHGDMNKENKRDVDNVRHSRKVSRYI